VHKIENFMFATGIENSYPTIEGGRIRVDEMEKCGHYDYWKLDFQRVGELGINFLRYGPPLHLSFLDRRRFDWSFSDAAFAEIKMRGITPIVDLCHFGVPDWIGNFQNLDFPELFAAYAGNFARRYPWVQLYTPVNEMMVCAIFSAHLGWWNEQLTDDRSFVTALKNIVKANILAMQEILKVRPDAVFIQSESSEFYHAVHPAVLGQSEFLNERRFLGFDLNYGIDVSATMYQFLLDNGMTKQEYQFFMEQSLPAHCVMGNDYYNTNEHRVLANGEICFCGEIFGYGEITQQYFNRYQMPVMHTETNFAQGLTGNEAVDWLWKQWANILCVRAHGVPIIGFTWYSLTDQVDWDTALREQNGRVNPLGLLDLQRNFRPVGLAYKELISIWEEVMPTQNAAYRIAIQRTAG